MEQFVTYLRAELRKLGDEGDATGSLAKGGCPGVPSLPGFVEGLMEVFASQPLVDEYVSGLGNADIVALTRCCSRWRDNNLANDLWPGRVRLLRPRRSFGEIALLRDIPRAATVRATAASTVLVLDREPFVAAVGVPRRRPQPRASFTAGWAFERRASRPARLRTRHRGGCRVLSTTSGASSSPLVVEATQVWSSTTVASATALRSILLPGAS